MAPIWVLSTAPWGTASTSLKRAPSRRTRTNWPGSTDPSGFWNSARTLTTPVVASTWVSVKLMRPGWG